jgi:hypothetical protein
MRFVPVKTADQQSIRMLHGTRQLFIRQRTTLINSIRAHLAEFGIVAGIGRNGGPVDSTSSNTVWGARPCRGKLATRRGPAATREFSEPSLSSRKEDQTEARRPRLRPRGLRAHLPLSARSLAPDCRLMKSESPGDDLPPGKGRSQTDPLCSTQLSRSARIMFRLVELG